MKTFFCKLLILSVTFGIVGCRTKSAVSVTSDSVLASTHEMKVKKDSSRIKERIKTVIFAKHDTIRNTDTIVITREKYVNRWRVLNDTINKVRHIDRFKHVKDASDAFKSGKDKKRDNAFKLFLILSSLWLVTLIYFRKR